MTSLSPLDWLRFWLDNAQRPRGPRSDPAPLPFTPHAMRQAELVYERARRVAVVPRRYPEASTMLEEAWRNQVVDLAGWCGWRVYYVENATREITRRGSGARVRVRTVNAAGVGFPDLVLVRRRDARLIFAELKRDKGAGSHPLGPEQEEWLHDIAIVAMAVERDQIATHEVGPLHLEVHVWRPADFEDVRRILT